MEKENASEQLNNNDEQDLGLPVGDDAAQIPWNNDVEFYMEDLLGTDEDPDAESGKASKRTKRFTMEQIAVLEAKFKMCPHPDPNDRKELSTRIGLEERQVRFWFQNRRSQKKLKDCGEENKDMLQENAMLRTENRELRQRLLHPSCFRCRGPAMHTQQTPEKLRLLNENARLKYEISRGRAHLRKLISEAEPPPSVSSAHQLASAAYMDPVQATLISHAERAMKELVMLATIGESMWLTTNHGETLNHEAYILQTFPGLLGLCPQGFSEEATKDVAMIKGTAMELVSMLTDVDHWSDMFPGIVADVSSSNVICSGSVSLRDGLIQLMNVQLWVQSSRLLNRSVKFLRFSKMIPNSKWAVVDVSVDGICGFEQTGCRLLPSGCLLEDMDSGYCKVTWLVHAEYDETTVPLLFRPFLKSGQALGASRWLRSLQRQCEYMAVLQSTSHIQSSSSSSSVATISMAGRRGVLELAHRMTASFYAAVSGPVTVPPTNIVDEWRVSTRRFEAAVRMVTWDCADVTPGEPAVTVVSATTTVWLPDTPPQRVFQYLCNLQNRAEWDTNANGAVEELGAIATSTYLYGNAVSVLRPTAEATTHGTTSSSSMLILQEASADASCSLVVYSFIEESSMRGVMDGGDNSNIFLLPSGFAILPDGHGKAHYNAANTSSTPIGHNNDNSGGSLLTVAYQAMMPGSPAGNFAGEAFDDAGQRICHSIKMIKTAVGAINIFPA